MRIVSSGPVDPETCRDLWGAVLADAVNLVKGLGTPEMPENDWGRYTTNERRIAADWMRARDSDVGSFRWICEMMNLDPDVVVERVFQRRAA